MVSPILKPTQDRSRFSLILRFGSSRTSDTRRSKYPTSPSSTDGTPSSGPSRPFVNLSPRRPNLPYSELLSMDNTPSNPVVVPPTSNELGAPEKARLLKKARKLSRVFGEMPILEQSALPLDDGSDGAYLSETEDIPTKRPSSPFSPSRGGSLKRRTLLRLSSQPDMMNQCLPAEDMHGEVLHAQPDSLPQPGPSLDIGYDSITNEQLPHTSESAEANSPGDHDKHSIRSVSTITCPEHQPTMRLETMTRHLDEISSPETSRLDDDRFPSLNINVKRKVKEKRRKSLDLALLSLPLFSSGGPSGSMEVTKLKRSESLRTGGSSAGQNNATSPKHCIGAQEHMDERERLLNVKRARKMTQLFGHDPPPELFHITHSVPERPLTPIDLNRNSVATFHSISSDSATSLPLSVTIPPVLALDTFPTPPSANTRAGDDTMPAPHDVKSNSFQERRRRAAKLSQFFGVAYQDITSTLAVPEPTVFTAKPTYGYLQDESPVQVDIKVSRRRRLWGLVDGRNNLREADIMDARDKLRGLKAA